MNKKRGNCSHLLASTSSQPSSECMVASRSRPKFAMIENVTISDKVHKRREEKKKDTDVEVTTSSSDQMGVLR